MKQLSDIVLDPSGTLLDAIAAIDRGAAAICCIVDDGRLVATMTDGDVRRALLAGASLESLALHHAERSPRSVEVGVPRALVLDIMRALRISAVPQLDVHHRLVGLHTLSDLVSVRQIPNAAVIMAGGKGTRLGALTKDKPKPLMAVAGRPILEWIILGLVGNGVRDIYISVNYLADQIVDAIGDGSDLGCSVRYVHESPDNPLGTGGSLALLDPLPQHPLLVMNGDLMVEFDAARLLEHHDQTGAEITVGTRPYNHSVPFGVIESDDAGMVRSIVEKPDLQVEINAAVYCVNPSAIGLFTPGEFGTMPGLIEMCLDRGRPVATWLMTSDWIDVGSPADLARAKGQT